MCVQITNLKINHNPFAKGFREPNPQLNDGGMGEPTAPHNVVVSPLPEVDQQGYVLGPSTPAHYHPTGYGHPAKAGCLAPYPHPSPNAGWNGGASPEVLLQQVPQFGGEGYQSCEAGGPDRKVRYTML